MKRILVLYFALIVCFSISITGFGKSKYVTVKLKPGDDIQAIVNANPAGTAYKLSAGIYRMQVIHPKDGDIFDGGNVAVLNGSKLLTEWVKEDDIWHVTGQTQEGLRIGEGMEMPGHPRAAYPEDVYIDDVPLLHAEHIADVQPGTFYFDYKSDRLYIGVNPSGHKIETSISDQAFTGNGHNIIIRNLTIEKYATPAQWGTVSSEFGINWIVQNNIIQLNHGCGVNFGVESKILRNKILKNGHAGFGGGGKDWLFEGNNVSDNGWAGIDPVWEGGGGKVTNTTGGIFRGNRVNGNNGPGIWLDIDANNIIIEDNVCWNNPLGPGIMFEISSGVIIRKNICVNNATKSNMCQIYISSSSNAKVYGNTIDVSNSGGDALIVLNMHRPPANPGVNNEIYNNTLIIRGANKGKVGIVNENEPDTKAVYSKNSFHNNIYHLSDLSGKYFMWDGRNNYTFDETQAAGHEAGSTADTNIPTPNPDLAETKNTIIWPTLTEPPFDKSLLNTSLEAPDAGPALWFKLDEASGTTVNDFSGKRNSGILQEMNESISWVPGHSGNALSLDGKDDNVKAGPLGMFRYLTIALWINPAKLDKEFNALIHTNGWKKGSVHIMISGNGRIQFALNGNQDGGQYSEKNVFTSGDLGKWKHVAIVYDAEEKLVKFYVNGLLNATRAYSKTILANLGDLQLGGWNGGGRNFTGKLDDVRIFGRALSDSEVAALTTLEK